MRLDVLRTWARIVAEHLDQYLEPGGIEVLLKKLWMLLTPSQWAEHDRLVREVLGLPRPGGNS